MSHVGLSMDDHPADPGDRRPKGHKKAKSTAAVLVSLGALVALVVAVVIVGLLVWNAIKGEAAADYPGPGNDEVLVSVESGQTVTDIGGTLFDANVVASVQAFVDASRFDDRANTITPGGYVMLTQMSGQGAFERMLDPESRYEASVTLPEGLWIDETIARTAEATDLTPGELWSAAADPAAVVLPDWAEGTGERRAEGFLFPAVYPVARNASASEALQSYVDRFNVTAEDTGIADAQEKVGVSAYEALIVASLVQSEGLPQDFTKVARVVYNRLDPETWGETFGYLQLDATLNYGLGEKNVRLTKDQLESANPYSTHTNTGLPPTPINSPGEEAITAALNPAEGDWLYYVTVNLETGETKFTDDYDEFLGYSEELNQWCSDNPDQC